MELAQQRRGDSGTKVAGYHVREARASDMAAMDALGTIGRFGVGAQLLRIYNEHAGKRMWYVLVCECTGRIVAYDTYHHIDDMGVVLMGYQVFVHPDYRGKGLTRMFNSMSYAKFESMGNATVDSIQRYTFAVWGEKLVGYSLAIHDPIALPPSESKRRVNIDRFDAETFHLIREYDRTVLDVDRSSFMRNYLSGGDTVVHGLRASDAASGSVLGYCILRNAGTFWSLAPCYADSPSVAMVLADEAIKTRCKLAGGKWNMFVSTRASTGFGPTLIRLLNLRGGDVMTPEVEFRCYSSKAAADIAEKKINWHKVYSIQEFWPA